MKKRKRKTPSAVLRAAGKHRIDFGIPLEHLDAVKQAAAMERRSLANFCEVAVVEYARQVIAK